MSRTRVIKYTDMSDAQRRVFEEVRMRLSDQPWFMGIRTDDFPTDEDIAKDFDSAVRAVMMETASWDDPDFYTAMGDGE